MCRWKTEQGLGKESKKQTTPSIGNCGEHDRLRLEWKLHIELVEDIESNYKVGVLVTKSLKIFSHCLGFYTDNVSAAIAFFLKCLLYPVTLLRFWSELFIQFTTIDCSQSAVYARRHLESVNYS